MASGCCSLSYVCTCTLTHHTHRTHIPTHTTQTQHFPTRTHTHCTYTHIYTHSHTYTHPYVHTRPHTCTHTCKHEDTLTHAWTHTHTHARIYTCTYTHTRTHTHSHIWAHCWRVYTQRPSPWVCLHGSRGRCSRLCRRLTPPHPRRWGPWQDPVCPHSAGWALPLHDLSRF